MRDATRLFAAAALAAGLSGCALDNSARIERERERAGMEARLAQAEDDLRRVQASCQDLERALNQERDARAALQQRLGAQERSPEPARVVKPAPRVEADETAGDKPVGEAAALAKIQAALQKAGYDPGPADGKMGHKTRQALMAFQKDNGLKPDGVVGPKTLAKLQGFLGQGEPSPAP